MGGVHLPLIDISLLDYLHCFYLKLDLNSRHITIFISGQNTERFVEICEWSEELSVSDDPFVFVVAAMSYLYDNWALGFSSYLERVQEIVSGFRFFPMDQLHKIS